MQAQNKSTLCFTCLHHSACLTMCSRLHNTDMHFDDFNNKLSSCSEYEADSNLLHLPFPIGSTIYELTQSGAIWERKVIGYHYNSEGKQKGLYIIIKCGCGLTSRINTSKVGVTVFDSVEEAEAGKEALKDWLVSS